MDVLALLPWRVAPALATALLHSLWQVTLLALVAALALAAMSQRHAATRHAVAMGVPSDGPPTSSPGHGGVTASPAEGRWCG